MAGKWAKKEAPCGQGAENSVWFGTGSAEAVADVDVVQLFTGDVGQVLDDIGVGGVLVDHLIGREEAADVERDVGAVGLV